MNRHLTADLLSRLPSGQETKQTLHMRVIAETISTEIVSAQEEVPRSILHAGRGRTGKTIEKSENQKLIRSTKIPMFLPLMLLCTCTNHAFKYCQNMWNEHRILYQETIKLSFVVCRTLAFERVRFFNESSHVTPKLGSQVDQTGLLKLHTACLYNNSKIIRSYTTYTKKLGPSPAWLSNIESKKYRSLLSTTKNGLWPLLPPLPL